VQRSSSAVVSPSIESLSDCRARRRGEPIDASKLPSILKSGSDILISRHDSHTPTRRSTTLIRRLKKTSSRTSIEIAGTCSPELYRTPIANHWSSCFVMATLARALNDVLDPDRRQNPQASAAVRCYASLSLSSGWQHRDRHIAIAQTVAAKNDAHSPAMAHGADDQFLGTQSAEYSNPVAGMQGSSTTRDTDDESTNGSHTPYARGMFSDDSREDSVWATDPARIVAYLAWQPM